MTDETKFRLLAAFRQMNQTINMRTFNDRLILQKKAYLLQELGMNLSNTYGWYIHGPYSRDVANDGFQLASLQDQIGEVPVLEEPDNEAVNTLQTIITEATRSFQGKDEPFYLELLASLHFILQHGYPKPANKEAALGQLLRAKSKFTRQEVETALRLLEAHGLA